jgi:hypothetical protein
MSAFFVALVIGLVSGIKLCESVWVDPAKFIREHVNEPYCINEVRTDSIVKRCFKVIEVETHP